LPRGPVAPKYRNPENPSETWAGRGLTPRWLAAAIKTDTYGQLPEPGPRGTFRLSEEYVTTAVDDVAQQLSKAGVRLAFVLNSALRKQESAGITRDGASAFSGERLPSRARDPDPDDLD
jgi:hypothetical protein